LQISNSLKTIEAQKVNRELAKEIYDVTESNYRLGLSNLTDLINAETELRTSENSYNDALLQYKVAELELIKAKGEIGTLLNN
jgi:outer membrane protein TolC